MTDAQKAMRTLGRMLRSASYWCDDGYYTSEMDSAVNRAKRETLDEIAGSIDAAFDVDSTMYPKDMRERRVADE